MHHQLIKTLIGLIFCFVWHAVNGSTQSSSPIPEASKPQTSVAIIPLTKYEQELLDEINSARKDPAAYLPFLEQYRTYYHGNSVQLPEGGTIVTNEGVAALDEAITFMRSLKPLPPLKIRLGMVSGARLHLQDLMKTGRIGHIGSDGSKPEDRLNLFGTWQDSVGEDIVYDSRSARNDVIGLIIDDGVATRGHRKNLFKSEFQVIGIARDGPVQQRTVCVITFAGGFTDKGSKPSAAVKY